MCVLFGERETIKFSRLLEPVLCAYVMLVICPVLLNKVFFPRFYLSISLAKQLELRLETCYLYSINLISQVYV